MTPIRCPKCKSELVVRNGRKGIFLGCKSYPNCKYIYDLINKKKISCPKCGKRMVLNNVKDGQILACLNYRTCSFSYETQLKAQYKIKFDFDKKQVFCPKCGKQLTVRSGKYGSFIGCTGYPKCNFTYNIK